MTTTIISHDVKDFDTWLSSFNAFAPTRKEAGELSAKIYRGSDAPNRVTVINEWGTVDEARSFVGQDELKAAMADAGVVGPPDIQFLEHS